MFASTRYPKAAKGLNRHRSAGLAAGLAFALISLPSCASMRYSDLFNPTVPVEVEHPPSVGFVVNEVVLAADSPSLLEALGFSEASRCEAELVQALTQFLMEGGIQVARGDDGENADAMIAVDVTRCDAVQDRSETSREIAETLGDNTRRRIVPENVGHFQRPLTREVASALETVRASSEGMPVVTLAFEFLVLTAAWWGKVRGADWAEIDRTDGVWTVPATRMKAKREHRVPLCRRAVVILEARRLGGGSPLVFADGAGVPLSTKRLRQLLQKHGIAAVPHGFGSSFRDWAAEETDHPREVIEAALAHVVQNRVEAAYRRTDLFERRRRLMNDWSGYLAGGSRKP